MINHLEKIEDWVMLEWFKRHWGIENFNTEIQKYIDRGFELDPKSGLLRNKDETAYLRPSHEHLLVGVKKSTILVRSGTGLILVGKEPRARYTLKENTKITIPGGEIHAFRPDRKTSLLLRFFYEGAITEDKKITPFYRFRPWIEYYGN